MAHDYLERFSRWKRLLLLLLMALFLMGLFSLNLGFSQIPMTHILIILAKGILPLSDALGLEASPSEETILLQIRLPRIVAGMLVGAALAGSGVALQAIFRNPMADPYILGVSAGAALGGATAIILGLGQGPLGPHAISLLAFSGGLGSSLLVFGLAKMGGRTPIISLLLSGLAVSIFLSALVTILIILSNPYLGELQVLIFWLLGSLAYSFWSEILAALPLILMGLGALYLLARQLNILLLGEEEAERLGVDVDKVKKAALLCSSLATSAAVAISGIIGFVGLMIPHIVRLLVGPDHRILLPSATLVGALYLVTFDALGRVIYRPAEFPVGVMTALAGAPFFLYLLKRKGGEYAL